MSKRVSKIEIQGLDELQRAFKNVPQELEASVIRTIARKPANKIVSLARKLFKPKDSGATKRSFGILKVQDRRQKFIEIGVKGRSLAWIFMLGAYGRKKKSGANTGDIKPIGNVIQEAAGKLDETVSKEMVVDINKVIVRGLRKYLR
jgi:hypothetical protein